MRGLPFPAGALLVRDESHENTPTPTPGPGKSLEEERMLIPIDPALNAVMFDTDGMLRDGITLPDGYFDNKFDEEYRDHPSTPNGSSHYHKYSEGPQGDPFAPQPPAYFREEEQLLPTPSKPVKRKRRVKREEECGFCQGTDKNKLGESEVMITCVECGRSGHPTCMDLGTIGDVLRSYEWKCIECKTCEVCLEKGDDERILFCDYCDRGWHMDCLEPPLAESPPGKWHCPMCPPLPPPFPTQHRYESSEVEIREEDEQMEIDPALAIDPTLREPSVASSSHSIILPLSPKKMSRNKGKSRAITTDESEDVDIEELLDVEVEDKNMPSTSKRNGRTAMAPRRYKGRRRTPSIISDDVPPPSPPLRPQKRVRVRMNSPPVQAPPSPKERMVVRLRIPSHSKGKGKARARESDDDGEGKGLFDDVLSLEDRDTSRTAVQVIDKERFERSRVGAEAKLVPPPTPSSPPDLHLLSSGIPFRPLRSTIQQLQLQRQTLSSSSFPRQHSPTPSTPGTPSIPSLKHYDIPGTSTGSATGLRIRTIRFGQFDIQTWYDAPFPEEFSNIPEGRLWICEFCLKYMKSRFGAQRHRMKCKVRHPPGDEIYRDGNISFFEVDGRKNKIYCQNLCLLSKMFLDHKSLFYDVEPFLFYVMAEIDDTGPNGGSGAHFIGYFSKEKRSPKDLNLSCIMTLPVRQRKGWGNLLIDFSYLLSKKERRIGTPERPLSALGALGYRNYWTLAIMRYLKTAPENPRMEDISSTTSMTIDDIYATLSDLNLITVKETRSSIRARPSPGQSIKVTRGGRKNGVARRHLQRTKSKDEERLNSIVSIPTDYRISWDRDDVIRYLENWEMKGYLTLKAEKLKWSPFLLTRTSNAIAADNIQTQIQSTSTSSTKTRTPDPSSMSLKPSSSSEVAAALTQTAKAFSNSPPEVSTSTPLSGSRTVNGLEQLADLALMTAGVNTLDTGQHSNTPFYVTHESPTPIRDRDCTNGSSISIPIRPITPPLVDPIRTPSKPRSRSHTPPPSASAIDTDALSSPANLHIRRSSSQSSQALWNAKSNHLSQSPNVIMDDAQLAKRLAQEMERPKRLLRSSSIISQALASAPATPQKSIVAKSMPKKSRVSDSPRSISPTVLTRSATRSMTQKATQDEINSKSGGRVLRGRTANKSAPGTSNRLSSGARSSSRLNGNFSPTTAKASISKALSSPKKSPIASRSPLSITAHGDGATTEHTVVDTDKTDSPFNTGLEDSEPQIEDAREIVIVNGHQTSDDTAWDGNLADTVMEDVIMKDEVVTLVDPSFESTDQSALGVGSNDVRDDDIDIDAEGEDEDAEGEPDPELDV